MKTEDLEYAIGHLLMQTDEYKTTGYYDKLVLCDIAEYAAKRDRVADLKIELRNLEMHREMAQDSLDRENKEE